MPQPERIAEIAREVAVANLASQEIASVLTEPTVDSQGEEALRITIAIEPGAERRFAPEAVLDTLVQIHGRLQRAGEERLPVVEYATTEELADGDDDPS